MIKIQFTGSSGGFYQNDRQYMQPSFTGAVQWNGDTKCFEVSTGGGWLKIDNTVELSAAGPDIWAMHAWIEEKKREEQELKDLRNKYPALDEAYKHLDLIKALVATDSK